MTIMGLAQIHDLVLATSAVKAFKGISSELINMKDFWLHSVFCAAIARLLARKCNVIDSERLFVCGILHDLGHLVIYAKCPTQASKVLLRAKQENCPIALLEKEVLCFDYADVGGELLKSWKLPASLYETVANHVYLKRDAPFSLDSAIIHIANILALQEESLKTGFPAQNLDLQALQMTGLNEEDLDFVKIEAKRNMVEILKLLFAKI
jgi:HD-like signal output (HDOD) protein